MIGLSFTLRVGMPMFSRLFALMNDQNRFGFVFRLSPIIYLVVYIGFAGSCQCFSSLSSKFPKLFPMFVQSSLFCFFMVFVFHLLCILINSRDIHGRWVFALVLQALGDGVVHQCS